MAGGRLNCCSDVACGQVPRPTGLMTWQTSLPQLFFIPACGFPQRLSACLDGICRLKRLILGAARRRVR